MKTERWRQVEQLYHAVLEREELKGYRLFEMCVLETKCSAAK
jgi:hypothetical protein